MPRFVNVFCAICSMLVMGGVATTSHANDRIVAFVFDQLRDFVLRIEDRNLDGDTLDPGEVSRFMDDTIVANLGVENSQGMLALGPHELLATDNFAPDNIVRLRDENRNGNAFDAGEATIFHNGALPGGFTLTNPVTLSSRVGSDALYTLDNNTIDSNNPEAIYELNDLNGDGDVNDTGEVATYFQLSPAGVSQTTTFDVEFDNTGNAYVIDITDPGQIESIDIIDPTATTIHEWITSTQLLQLAGVVIPTLVFELTHDPVRDEIIIGAETASGSSRIVALKDLNGSGTIDSSNEIRIVWSETANADGVTTGATRDLHRLSDGSILFLEASIDEDNSFRIQDRNGDGDFNDLGETQVFYDAAAAGLVGLPAVELALSITGVALPSGDFVEDGQFDCLDINSLVAAIVGASADPSFDMNADGRIDFGDVDEWLAVAGAVELASGGSYLPGDANLDGTVDGEDFLAWNAHKFSNTAEWCHGDFNADGVIDGSDFLIWNANKFTSADSRLSAVPEPIGTPLGILAVMLLAAALQR